MDIKKIAQLAGGTVEGDGSIAITGLSGIDSVKAGDLTFALDEDRLAMAERSGASCVLTDLSVRKSSKPLIRVKNPKFAFLVIYNALNTKKTLPAFTHPTAVIAPSVKRGKDAWIGPYVVIEDGVTMGDGVIIGNNCTIRKNCRIGSGCHLYSVVTLYDNTVLGKNVTLHSGVVLGADGFGYVKEGGAIFKFPQLGKVIIEDDVEIGANTTVDRGSLSDTVIGAGTKIDNLCQIAHNVKIGKNCLIAAQTGISGSTVVKDNVTMGGQVGIVDNIAVGSNVMIAAQSGVTRAVKDGEVVMGYPARPIAQTQKQYAVVAWLTKRFDKLSKLLK